MIITEDTKQRLKELPIEDVAEKLGLSVSRHQCLCFMHDDHHPSMVFNMKNNTWKCYACDVYGDSISLVQHKLNLGFQDACAWLGSQYAIDTGIHASVHAIPKEVKWTAPKSKKKEEVTVCLDKEVMEFVLEACNLQSSIMDNFMYKLRGFSKDAIDSLNIRFLNAHNGLAKAIIDKFGEERARKSGMVYKKDGHNVCFYNAPCLLFPYYSIEGELLCIQSRYLGNEDKSRFQFPKGSKVSIFNLPILRDMNEGDELYIAEGVTDCIALLSEGKRAIAIPSATLLKKQDLCMLARFALKMYPDQDDPGERLFQSIQNGVCEYGGTIERLTLPEGTKDYSDYHTRKVNAEHEMSGDGKIRSNSEETTYLRQKGKGMELVINTFGAAINRDNEAFVISNTEGRQRIPVDGINSIQIGRGVQVTSDAIMLAIEHEIDLAFNDKTGQPVGRVWSPKYGSISTIRKGQLNFTFTHDALSWIKEVICKKIENQQALIMMFESEDTEVKRLVNKAITRLEDYRNKIKCLEGEIVADVAPSLRGWEGQASKVYFDALNLFLPEELRFENRSQKPARDVVNAFLNYGYGILYGRIEAALIKAGIDPYVGVLHRDDYNRPVLVYDVIELYRVWVDYVVYSIAAQGIVTDEYYSVREDGSFWLENLGRRVLIQSFNDFLEEVVTHDRVQRSRLTQIQLYAQRLAQIFKNTL